jgi:hypothetical protein
MHREVSESDVEQLLNSYFKNFAGSVAPIKASIIGNLRAVLRETTVQTLEPLVISVAKDGMILTRNSLLVAKAKRDTPPPKATPMPPRVTEPERTDAIPMPDYVREELMKALRKKGG